MDVIKHQLADDLIIYQGHVLDAIALLPDKSVHCCPTSGPYYGLRSYGAVSWEGGDPDCNHEAPAWADDPGDLPGMAVDNAKNANAAKWHRRTGGKCPQCGAHRVDSAAVDWPEVTYSPMPGLAPITVPAWNGPLGNEPTPEMYVGHYVLIYRALWPKLRDKATAWLNFGDSYNGSGGAGGDYSKGGLREGQPKYPGRNLSSLKRKDLLGIPWRAAFALQADGWYLRAAPPWVKANPMPESVTDRPCTAHEAIFLLTKSEDYYYDEDAIRVQATPQSPSAQNFRRKDSPRGKVIVPGQAKGTHREGRADTSTNPDGRSRRTSDWWNESLEEAAQQHLAQAAYLQHIREHGGLLLDEAGNPLGLNINTEPLEEAHFAPWPRKLVEPMILSSTSPQACPKCGAPWERIVEKRPAEDIESYHGSSFTKGKTAALKPNVGQQVRHVTVDTGNWKPTCNCEENDGSGKCVVYDPFWGSGTTGQVALSLGRAAWGSELNPEYVQMSIRARGSRTQSSLLGMI